MIKLRKFFYLILVGLFMAVVFGIGSLASIPAVSNERSLPIVFVHGYLGSAAQYETQALRWASNDYPNLVTGIDRTTMSSAELNPMLDEFFDSVMAETGDSQVFVVAHSMGTSLMVNYLNSSPERSGRVAKYINIDGARSVDCPGNPGPVDCMNIARDPNSIMGPINIHLTDYGHTQAVTSDESFAEQYKFFTGKEPATTLVLPERPDRVEIAGRVLNYPANTGIIGSTLELWEVHSTTGARKHRWPNRKMVLDAAGNFGPWRVNGQHRYEINVIRPSDEGPRHNHFYYEPFMRSNYLLRLNISPLNSALSQVIRDNSGPHSGVSVVRQKEWWGDNPVNPENVDVLNIITKTRDGVVKTGNVVTAETASYSAYTIAMLMFDVENDGITHTDALVNLGLFLSGIDAYMPARADPPNGRITFASRQRGTKHPQIINTPNWSMDARHFINVNFRDFAQGIDSWGECMRKHPHLCR